MNEAARLRSYLTGMRRILTWIFYNPGERRYRALTRLVAHTAVLITLGLALFVAFLPYRALLLMLGFDLSVPGLPGSVAFEVLLVISVMLVAGRALDRRVSRGFGLVFDRHARFDLAFGFLLGAILIEIIFVAEYLMGWIAHHPRPATSGLMATLAECFVLFTGVAVAEELLSRSYHLTNLAEGLRFRWLPAPVGLALAVLLSSAVFGGLHALNPHASLTSTLCLVLAGVELALPYVLTGRIALSVGMHLSWNFFQGNVFGFPVSGQRIGESLIVIEQLGPEVWTGGAFGPEAGYLGILAIILGCCAICFWVRVSYGSVRNRLQLFPKSTQQDAI